MLLYFIYIPDFHCYYNFYSYIYYTYITSLCLTHNYSIFIMFDSKIHFSLNNSHPHIFIVFVALLSSYLHNQYFSYENLLMFLSILHLIIMDLVLGYFICYEIEINIQEINICEFSEMSSLH
jgi:hypothetical protein